jgi:hypothetical protein
MKISELELLLKKIRDKEGDLNVCVSESHEYWGSVDSHLEEYNVDVSDHAQPEGPKSGKSERAVRLKTW